MDEERWFIVIIILVIILHLTGLDTSSNHNEEPVTNDELSYVEPMDAND